MTKEEAEQVEKRLREAGVPVNGWFETQESPVHAEALQNQVALLDQLKGLLQAQLDDDMRQIDALRRQLAMKQHGGGQ